MIANSVAFYMDGHPKPLALFPRTSPWTNTTDQMRKSGIAFICPVDDKGCILMRDGTEINLTIDKRVEVTIVPHWLGFAGQPESFAIDILAPSIDTPKQTDVIDEGSQRLPYTEIICNELISKVPAGTLILLQSVGNQTDQLIADEYQKCLEGNGFKVLRTIIATMAPTPGHKITLDKMNAPAVEVLIAPSAN